MSLLTEQQVREAEITSGKKISQYLKNLKIEPDHVGWIERYRVKHDKKRALYRALNDEQKITLHQIAPIWANILQYGIDVDGGKIVTADDGRQFNLNSISGQTCLVGEVHGFNWAFHSSDCRACGDYNSNFACLGDTTSRMKYEYDLKGFLNHYKLEHLTPT